MGMFHWTPDARESITLSQPRFLAGEVPVSSLNWKISIGEKKDSEINTVFQVLLKSPHDVACPLLITSNDESQRCVHRDKGTTIMRLLKKIVSYSCQIKIPFLPLPLLYLYNNGGKNNQNAFRTPTFAINNNTPCATSGSLYNHP